jgi:hypothetical protein
LLVAHSTWKEGRLSVAFRAPFDVILEGALRAETSQRVVLASALSASFVNSARIAPFELPRRHRFEFESGPEKGSPAPKLNRPGFRGDSATWNHATSMAARRSW